MATKKRKLPKFSADNNLRRTVLLFKGYLDGRICALEMQKKDSPASAGECDSAISELQYIADNILPELLIHSMA